jgi:hypothetical protein
VKAARQLCCTSSRWVVSHGNVRKCEANKIEAKNIKRHPFSRVETKKKTPLLLGAKLKGEQMHEKFIAIIHIPV